MQNQLDKTKVAIKVDTVEQAEEVVKWFGLPKADGWNFFEYSRCNWIAKSDVEPMVNSYGEYMISDFRFTKLTYAEWNKAIGREIVGYKKIKDYPFGHRPIGSIFSCNSANWFCSEWPEFFEPVYTDPIKVPPVPPSDVKQNRSNQLDFLAEQAQDYNMGYEQKKEPVKEPEPESLAWAAFQDAANTAPDHSKEECPDCKGTGQDFMHLCRCKTCNGTGRK